MDTKRGALTIDELLEVWRGAVAEDFAEPLIEAGEGNGLEVTTQGLAQLERVSRAIDRSTQSLYILPHSSQTAPPASGGELAEVVLTVTRTKNLHLPVVIEKGRFVIEEVQVDWGENDGETVYTGRRFIAQETVMFAPGDTGPLFMFATAERPGDGYNNPLPGTLRRIVQVGAGFTNDQASVTAVDPPLTAAPEPRASATLISANQADTVHPEHVGAYVQFTAGSNAGRVFRTRGYTSPNPPTDGGRLELELLHVVSGSVFTGVFSEGEQVVLYNSGVPAAYGLLVAERSFGGKKFLAIQITTVAFASLPGATLVQGVRSSAQLTFDTVVVNGINVTVTGPTETWRVFDWASDLGVVVTNEAQPANGRTATLDELGIERGIFRTPNEEDGTYRQRIARVADVVSPNALRRAINRVLVPIGRKGYLREVGYDLAGLFMDGSSADIVDAKGALDLDFVTRPQDRFKLALDVFEMRGFFLVGCPPFASQDFGAHLDGTTADPNPGTPAVVDVSFFDGFPVFSTEVYRALWQVLEAARAGGVGFDLYVETVDATS